MTCLSSRSFTEDTTNTRTACQTASQRSVLPPAPTSAQLLSILHEAGQLLLLQSDANTIGHECAAPLRFSSASAAEYAAYIRRQCPTGRRVQSSFAAAGARSALGEMLQFFAVSLTRLFSEGAESATVLSFPTEWEQRLNSPDAAALREKYLYELQGFSTLFTYVWGNVAASHPPVHESRDEFDRSEEAEENMEKNQFGKDGRSARIRTAAPAAVLPASSSPHRSDERQVVNLRRPTPIAADAGAGVAAPLLPQLGNTISSTNGTIAKRVVPSLSSGFNSDHGVTPPRKATTLFSNAINRYPSRESTVSTFGSSSRRHQSLSLPSSDTTSSEAVVLFHGVAVEAKGHQQFLPSLPLEGLVPSRYLSHMESNHAANTLGGRKAASQVSSTNGAPTLFSQKEGEGLQPPPPRLTPSARQSAIQQAMEQDRQRELKRTLGVRRVRNFAKEEDMQEYLRTFQRNILSVLEEDAEGQSSEGADPDGW